MVGVNVQMCVSQFLRPREVSGRELVKVLLLTVGLPCLLISTALINVCLHLTQRLPHGTVALIMVVCVCLCICVTQHCCELHCYTSTDTWIFRWMSRGPGVAVTCRCTSLSYAILQAALQVLNVVFGGSWFLQPLTW